MKKFIEGSYAVAEAVKLCRPGVVSAYPITPQTHIVEGLAQFVADGELKAEFVNVESEHSAASAVLGAVATGVRAFTSSSSQGLLLMTEVIFNIAGMRLPLVLACANRAVSAPINIWNDQQDVMTIRDSGWILLFAENIQEVIDLHIQAYRISEDHSIMLPVMVNLDGYILTHGLEVADMPSQEQVDKFLPPYKPLYKLDTSDPMTLGCLAMPEHYMEARVAIQKTQEAALDFIPKVAGEFKKVFGRESGGLVEAYKIEDAKQVIVAMGSIVGTIKETVDELRAQGKKVGVLKLITYRPFPKQAILNALKNVPEIAVVDKSISLGSNSPLYTDLTSAFIGQDKVSKISGFVLGLGGRDITKDSIKQVFDKLSGKQVDCEFIDVKKELLEEEYAGN
ncbi:MAG TPA: transketolase C-terminal domain-containing protein [Candidatus Omnitrophota bacterium]|nr:transketolase C-terminal domain-containing protein [Candidatus Omnitrophota bacterium]